jgi:translocation and assembly module TamB
MSLRRKIILGLLLLVLLLPTALVYYIATTESGLRLVAERLGKLGPVTLTIRGVKGTLVTGFSIENLRIQHRLSDVQATQVQGHVELLPLLAMRIHIPTLKVDTVSVQVFRSDRPRSDWIPRFLPSMLRIDVDSATAVRGKLIAINDRIFDVRAVSAAGTVLPKQIRIQSFALDYDLIHLSGMGRVLAALPFGIEGTVTTLYTPKGLPAWSIVTDMNGDLDQLPLVGRIDKPFNASFKGAAYTLTTGWNIKADSVIRNLDINAFGGGKALGIISGNLAVTLDSSGFTARGPLTPTGLKAGPMAIEFDGSYTNKHVQIRRATAHHAASGSRVHLRGGVDFGDAGPRLALNGTWSPLQWPLTSKQPAFRSPSGSYKLSGVKPWDVEARGDIETIDAPLVPATLRGKLTGDALTIDAATAQWSDGLASFAGNARWNPAESWRISGNMRGMNPQKIRPDLPGKLDFNFAAEAAPFGNAGTLDLRIERLTGTLRKQPAAGGGHFILPAGSKDWHFDKVDLRFGRTRIQLDGGLGAQRDLRFAIDADDLSLFDAGAKGRVSARGRYAGTADAPLLLLKAQGSDFEWQGRRIAAMDANVDINLAPGGRAQGKIELRDLTLSDRTVQKLSLQLDGPSDAQRLNLQLDAKPLHSVLSAGGKVEDGQWRGTIQTLSIDDAHNLRLSLEAPAALAFNLDDFQLGRTCLKDNAEKVCIDAQRVNQAWNTHFSAEALPLRALTAGLTQELEYEGTINLVGDAAGSKQLPITGNLRGELQNARLRHHRSNGREEIIALGTGEIVAVAGPADFSVQVRLDAASSGKIEGALTGNRAGSEWHAFPIKGNLDASTDALGLLEIYVGGIDRATGRLNTSITIGGTLGQPEIQGLLLLRDAQIDLYQVNLSLRDLTLDAKFNADALDLSGQSRIGDGVTQFHGRLAWRNREPFGALHFEGKNLRLVNVPEARIEASPNLDFKLEGRRMEITGEVEVPLARLEPADLANAVLVSNDERMVGAPLTDPAQRWIVVSDIRLSLGDNVRVNSLGLNAKLGGSITLRTDESQISRGQGELNVVEGKYAYLGRLLDIERGKLIFNNGPVGDPGIDLRAQKVYADITAGLNVRGSLRNPRLTFFSEPAIPQSQIASLILAGGSLESVQNSTRTGAARNDLLAQGGAILAQQLGSRVGIEDVGIESDLSNETSLVLGKYLSPRLYVSYGISLAEAINTLKLRYTIGDRWTLKTEAGKARSADIVYTIRK